MSKLTVHNAQITTATVEIKTLTISGKQVTLAVFRQLREEPLIANDGTLNGVPWGTVNYHPGKCGDTSPHWHVVWQQGSELLRATVGRREGLYYQRWGSEQFDTFYSLCCAAQLHGDLPERWFAGKPIPKPGTWTQDLIWRGQHCGLDAEATARHSVVQAARGPAFGGGESALDAMDEDFRPLTGPVPRERAIERLWEIVKAQGNAEVARRGRWKDAREAISDLPQLFIAT